MTKAQIRLFQSLSRQKYRKEHNAYLVEGDKNAKEWLQSDIKIQSVALSETWLRENEALVAAHPEAEVLVAEAFELEKITSLQHAQEVVLIVAQPETGCFTGHRKANGTCTWKKYRTPGNMGDYYPHGRLVRYPTADLLA